MHWFFEKEEFNDIVAFVKEKYPEDCELVIRKADETCENTFIFDCRWDLESTFFPMHFDGPVDWLAQNGDDPERTYALNRMRYWICMAQAFAVNGNEQYVKTFCDQLVDWVTRIKRENPECAPAWRTIEAGFRLEYWLKAYLIFTATERGESLISQDVKDIFVQSVREHAQYIVDSYSPFNRISNWGVLANHGLFMAGLFLDDDSFVHTALKRLEQEIITQVYADGMQWEQSPMYHNEVLHDFLDVLVLARRNAVAIPSVVEKKVEKMCIAASWFQKPDCHQIMMGDSDDLDVSWNVCRGAWFFKNPKISVWSPAEFDFDTIWDTGYKAALEYAAMDRAEPDSDAKFFSQSGNMYARIKTPKEGCINDTYVHFHCGTLGAGHGHSDQLHLDVFSGGEDILVDSGRFTYVPKDERYQFKGPAAHNTVSVDGETYNAWVDSWSSKEFCRPVNQKCIDTENYTYFEGGHTGYLPKCGVFVNRRVLVIKPYIILILDEFFTQDDGKEHTYRQFFHFSDGGKSFPENRSVFYSGKKTRAIMRFGRNEGVNMKRTLVSRHYNKASINDSTIVELTKKGFACMSAVIFLDATIPCKIEYVPVTSVITGNPLPPEQIEAWNVYRGSHKYTVVCAHTEFAAPTDMFYADGCTGFANTMIFDRTNNTCQVILD